MSWEQPMAEVVRPVPISNHPALLTPAPPLLIQGGEFSQRSSYLCRSVIANRPACSACFRIFTFPEHPARLRSGAFMKHNPIRPVDDKRQVAIAAGQALFVFGLHTEEGRFCFQQILSSWGVAHFDTS